MRQALLKGERYKMEEITTNISEIVNKQFKATISYIVWRTENTSSDVLVTEHSMRNGKPGAARTISKKSLMELCALVMPKIKKPPVFLSPDILGYSPTSETIIWWKKPCQKNLFFSQVGMNNGKAPLPGLIFQVRQRRMTIWALKTKDRPEPKTELYHAPFFNVNDDVCMGNTPLPQTATPNNYLEWEKAFFNSAFSHESAAPVIGTTAKKLWLSLVNSKTGEFPIECLAKGRMHHKNTPLTLAHILSEE